MAARKNRKPQAVTFCRPPDKHALKIALLRFLDSEVHLRKCPSQNQDHPGGQADDGQFERREEVQEFHSSAILVALRIKLHQANEIEDLRFLAFECRLWSGHFEKPGPAVASGPCRDYPGIAAGHIGAGELPVSIFKRPNQGSDRFLVSRRQSDLLSPPINIIGIAAAIAGKGYY